MAYINRSNQLFKSLENTKGFTVITESLKNKDLSNFCFESDSLSKDIKNILREKYYFYRENGDIESLKIEHFYHFEDSVSLEEIRSIMNTNFLPDLFESSQSIPNNSIECCVCEVTKKCKIIIDNNLTKYCKFDFAKESQLDSQYTEIIFDNDSHAKQYNYVKNRLDRIGVYLVPNFVKANDFPSYKKLPNQLILNKKIKIQIKKQKEDYDYDCCFSVDSHKFSSYEFRDFCKKNEIRFDCLQEESCFEEAEDDSTEEQDSKLKYFIQIMAGGDDTYYFNSKHLSKVVEYLECKGYDSCLLVKN
ncbi:hypothetical protein Catovirus_1_630 [Catovirus CTV1]|uniref:Uncharacterized protein n=1 Tax=Catovirus CTV1 TaxID=1977631 RepID=A0A1V0SA39_9VIRU|nr:hypothetical protein Catovirus_1_630 [Catovirus CTV1]